MPNLESKFTELFQKPSEVTAVAPGRVNLIGEHVDFLDGFVLPFAIDNVTTSLIARNNSTKIRVASAQENFAIETFELSELKPLTGPIWTRYPIGVVWALEIKEGLDILIDGQVPMGSGLSSSAALEASVATALNKLFKLNISLGFFSTLFFVFFGSIILIFASNQTTLTETDNYWKNLKDKNHQEHPWVYSTFSIGLKLEPLICPETQTEFIKDFTDIAYNKKEVHSLRSRS